LRTLFETNSLSVEESSLPISDPERELILRPNLITQGWRVATGRVCQNFTWQKLKADVLRPLNVVGAVVQYLVVLVVEQICD
jgi:hypothetical protein